MLIGRQKLVVEKRFPSERFKRGSAEVLVEATKEVLPARVFFNDLLPRGVILCVNEALQPNTEVSVVIHHPRPLYLKGRVLWSHFHGRNIRVLTQEYFNFRMGIQFSFATVAEQELVQDYCDSLTVMLKKSFVDPKAS